MRTYRIIAVVSALLMLAACSTRTSVSGTVAQAPDSKLVLKQLNGNAYEIVDSVKTDALGSFSCRLKVEDAQPVFCYLFYGDTRIAALLLEKGEKAVVTADTLGNYSVEGSEGSALLLEEEKAQIAFVRLVENESDPAALARAYVDYYRSRVKFVMSHPHSLAVIPVLTEQLDANTPVFSQLTDAIHFRAACDSLKSVYPDSRYVKALEKETVRRENLMKLDIRLGNASALSYPDLEMPDNNGERRKLSETGAKVVMLHFWNPSDASHKMMNLDVLLPVYNEFHSLGFEIYSVAVGVDKSEWAAILRAQKLPWINVNDGLGTASPSLGTYNVQQLPSSFLISEDGISLPTLDGAAGLRAELAKLLK